MVEEVKSATKEFKPLIRIVDKDIDGNESVWLALTRVKGVDFMLSNAICGVLNLPKLERCGNLTEEDIKKIEACMANPSKFGIPAWMLNRRKDPETGEDRHLVGANVGLQQNLDIRFLKKIKNYRGIRHAKGKKVRGQRTRTTGRKGGTLGVVRQKETPKTTSKAGKKEAK
ncbi:MAG: 30S ribosomal protein S13 [Candidatus Nanoarchaeia archaeon]